MKKKVSPIPKGFRTVTPSLVFKDCKKALAFYEKAFGAKTAVLMQTPGGTVGHAELHVGDSPIFCSDEWPNNPVKVPAGSLTSGLYLYVKDCDAWIKRAAAAGAAVTMPAADMFYGDRVGAVSDPFGYLWTIATHVEDVPPAEMKKREKAWLAKAGL